MSDQDRMQAFYGGTLLAHRLLLQLLILELRERRPETAAPQWRRNTGLNLSANVAKELQAFPLPVREAAETHALAELQELLEVEVRPRE